MKTFAARFILFYSAILATFIIVSGSLTMDGIEDGLFLLAFLPVATYLVVTTLKEVGRIIKKKAPSSDVSLSGKKAEFVAGIFIFIILFVVGVKNLTNPSSAQNNTTNVEESTEESDETTPLIFEKREENLSLLTVNIEDGSPFVNLRSGPGTFNEIAGEATNGQEFSYSEVAQGWYKIDFDGKEAWIFEDYVKLNE